MIEHDFAALRSAARDSVIGRAIAWTLSAVGHAAQASATRRVMAAQAAAICGTGPETTQAVATMLMTAAFATWVLSQFVPRYVSMAIPSVTFLGVAIVCGLVAWRPDAVVSVWSRSRLRRVSDWLRGV